MNQQTIERFWAKVNKTDTCWIWTGSKRNKGYGAFVWRDETSRVIQGRSHRFVYELLVGAIPKGMMVLHQCDNPACVNPKHLFLGTNQDNVTDMCRKGRHVSGGTYTVGNYKNGENHYNAKLTKDKIREIRAAKELLSYSKLSSQYSISIGHLHRIVTHKAWNNIE